MIFCYKNGTPSCKSTDPTLTSYPHLSFRIHLWLQKNPKFTTFSIKICSAPPWHIRCAKMCRKLFIKMQKLPRPLDSPHMLYYLRSQTFVVRELCLSSVYFLSQYDESTYVLHLSLDFFLLSKWQNDRKTFRTEISPSSVQSEHICEYHYQFKLILDVRVWCTRTIFWNDQVPVFRLSGRWFT